MWSKKNMLLTFALMCFGFDFSIFTISKMLISCKTNSDCPDALMCTNNKCLPKSCTINEHCKSDKGQFICPNNNKNCQICRSDSDCSGIAPKCSDIGSCVSCISDADCSGKKCTNNTCISCSKDTDCKGNPAGSHCNTESGLCQCVNNSHCSEESICTNNTCVKSAVTKVKAASMAATTKCKANGGACTTTTECCGASRCTKGQKGYTDGVCQGITGSACKNDVDCLHAGTCKNGKCCVHPLSDCKKNSDCCGGSCKSGKCCTPTGGTCNNSRSCCDGLMCLVGPYLDKNKAYKKTCQPCCGNNCECSTLDIPWCCNVGNTYNCDGC